MKSVKTIEDVDLGGLKVLVRVDFNVPLDERGEITDDTRIRAALTTLKRLIKQGAKVILASHLGRPKGQRKLEYTLQPVAKRLAELLGQAVHFLPDCIGSEAKSGVAGMEKGSIVLLENLRFHSEEEANDPGFAKELASLAEAYVNDAFGTAHRAHASTAGIAPFFKIRVAGFLMAQEIEYLSRAIISPERPFTVILGGAKVSDKIQVIEALLSRADKMLIGGAMAYTFKLAQGQAVGNSLVEADYVDTALACLARAKKKGVEFLLPVDTVITDYFDFPSRKLGATKVVEKDIPEGWSGVDIGPKTAELFKAAIADAKTILWNGPMGVFEIQESAKGTFAIGEAIAKSDALSIIGGGDSVTAVKQGGFAEHISFMSTGGGASLALLEGKALPGILALETR